MNQGGTSWRATLRVAVIISCIMGSLWIGSAFYGIGYLFQSGNALVASGGVAYFVDGPPGLLRGVWLPIDKADKFDLRFQYREEPSGVQYGVPIWLPMAFSIACAVVASRKTRRLSMVKAVEDLQ